MISKLKVAVVCGGPSLERGISLNSARSVCDHLNSEDIEIVPFYVDYKKNFYQISRAQLYSNTPSDFDFKLKATANPLAKNEFIKALQSTDLVFPVMHGAYGEDGKFQKFLEQNQIPYIGTDSEACKLAFDKYNANEYIREHSFYAPKSLLLKKKDEKKRESVKIFFKKQKIKRAIVKPATGGSSIAVYSVSSVEDAIQKAEEIFSSGIDTRVVVERFCEGQEFTVILLENRFGLPVAVLPTEIELDYKDHNIFDYRKKYLATRQVTYHCPPRFDDALMEKIQIQAEQLYVLLGMRDFARFDGWILENGDIWFSDFNPISGMEQNSFLFMQAARIGMSHTNVLRHIIKTACRRYQLKFSERETKKVKKKKEVAVLFGGNTAERQVSLMSGTNVWLKLRHSKKYKPVPYFLDSNQMVWNLPYAFALNHTVEEVEYMCKGAERDENRLNRLKRTVLEKLSFTAEDVTEEWSLPKKRTLAEFAESNLSVFLGLHGGDGENGNIQKVLEESKVYFNGAGSSSSKICANKFLTGEIVTALDNPATSRANRRRVRVSSFSKFTKKEFKDYWNVLLRELSSETVIVKPIDDGCSAGIARLYSEKDLETYLSHVNKRVPFIQAGALTEQHGIIEMPESALKNLLFEEFIITDKLEVVKNKLSWEERTAWVEITVGVLEDKGKLRALNPSITVASGNVLSLEEKFQGGTGVNITPPPKEFVPPFVCSRAKAGIEEIAKALGIQGYARIDAFLNIKNGNLIIIEANTLPGLTAATVIFHQALAENPEIYPLELLEKIVESSEKRYTKPSMKNVALPKVTKIS